MSEAAKVLEPLLPILRQEGLVHVKRFTLRGQPWRVQVFGQSLLAEAGDQSFDPTLCPSAELYEIDAYPDPDQRGEIFVHTWGSIGNSCKRSDIAAALTVAGFKARVTTKKKCWGIAIQTEAWS